MSPVRHVSSPRLLTQTAPAERPPGAWRYTSHLALVLSGGGARGAYQVGVLAGLADTEPLRAFLAQCAHPRGIAANIAYGRLRSVALSATSYTTGRPVTFVQGASDTPTWDRAHGTAVPTALTLDHVMASAALPIVFPAVRIGAEYYGDGGIRQTAPLAPALRLGARAVVAIGLTTPRGAASTAGPRDYPSAAQALGLLFDAVFLDALEADAERVDRVKDRKSTRLNSSHLVISYAVFCLKKKKELHD